MVLGCDQPTDPIDRPERRILVHAVLDAGTLLQRVKVQYVDGNFGHRLANIGNAIVTITTPTGAIFVGDEVADGAEYQFIGLGGSTANLLASGTYTLHILTPAGEEVVGTTTMPTYTDLPEAVFVIQPFHRETDTLRLEWKRVPRAARYEVAVESFVRAGNTGFNQLYSTFADTSITIGGKARTLENDLVFAGEVATIVVSAVDDNYYTYYHASVDPFAGAPPSRLTGAIGVFGAMVPIVNRTYQDVR